LLIGDRGRTPHAALARTALPIIHAQEAMSRTNPNLRGGALPASPRAASLRDLEDLRRSFIELTADWYWEQDNAFQVTSVDGALAREDARFGAERLGRPLWEFGLTPRDGTWQAYREALASGIDVRTFVVSYRALDDSPRHLDLSAQPLHDDAGRVRGYRGIARDITHRQIKADDLERFRAAVDASGDAIYLVDYEHMCFIYANRIACQWSGRSLAELLRVPPHVVLSTSNEEVRRSYDDVIAAGDGGTITEANVTLVDGAEKVVELQRRAVKINERWVIITIVHDVTERSRSARANERLRHMFALLSSTNESILRGNSPDDLYQRICDGALDGSRLVAAAMLIPVAEGILRIAAIASKSGGHRPRSELGGTGDITTADGAVAAACSTQRVCISAGDALGLVSGIAATAAVPIVRERRTDGVLLFCADEDDAFDEETVDLFERMAENVGFALDNFEHEEARKRSEDQIQYLATHDSLTGLPNRAMFGHLLQVAIDTARRNGREFALLFIDLDRFKVINDTLGHDAGDLLLKELALRLRASLRSSDIIGRLGGDEFVVLLQETGRRVDIGAAARKIIAAAMKPVDVLGQDCRVTASIGISIYPRDAEDAQSLMKRADLAMYAAKDAGKNNFQFYSTEIQMRSVERMNLETHLRRALERDELTIVYQPKLDLKHGFISGVEALLRWNSAELGPVSPAQFIPVAEETGLIIPIGRWVLTNACRQNMLWQAAGLNPVRMAVNLSPRQFADPDLLHDITEALDAVQMSPGLLELEITEGMVMHDTAYAIGVLHEIKQLGVRVAIDDFGTGYSSLAQLKQFPIDTLKVDRSFINELPYNAEDRSITEAIIAMGKCLSLAIVAEGVETPEQQQFLREHACDEMQGFYFARPMPPAELSRLLARHSRTSQTR
jgi:diguanylate cyclase (GGDEF)-like protein/PAS domain S-box-containing protein